MKEECKEEDNDDEQEASEGEEVDEADQDPHDPDVRDVIYKLERLGSHDVTMCLLCCLFSFNRALHAVCIVSLRKSIRLKERGLFAKSMTWVWDPAPLLTLVSEAYSARVSPFFCSIDLECFSWRSFSERPGRQPSSGSEAVCSTASRS